MPNNKKRDGFIMQAGILAAAGIIVRVIGLLYNTPLVAIIGDEGFGYYDSAYAAYSIVLLISSYSIPSAVSKVIAQKLALKEYRNAHRIFRCAFIYVLVVGGIASLFVFFGADLLVKMDSAVLPLKVLAPTIFFSGILGVLRGYFQAHKTMVQTSVSQIIEQLVNAGVSVGMAYVLVSFAVGQDASVRASYGAAGGTIGTGAGVLAGLLFMVFVYVLNKKSIDRKIKRDRSHQDDSYGAIFKMILMVVTPFIISTGIYNINNFMDKTIYQVVMMNVRNMTEAAVATDLSAFAKGTKISNIPIAMASAMATALIPGISSDFAKKDLKGVRDKVARSVKVTMLISIPAAVGIGVLAKPVMKVIFHQPETLDLASMLLTCMAVTVILYGLSTLTQAILQSIGRMNTPIINATAAVVIHAGIMAAMLIFLDEAYSLYYYVGATVLYALLLCVLNQISVRHYLGYRQEIDKTFLRPLLASTAMGAAAFLTYQGLYLLTKINVLSLAVSVGVSVLIYFLLIIRLQAVTEAELAGMPKGHMLIHFAKKLKLLKEEPQKEEPQKKKSQKQNSQKNKPDPLLEKQPVAFREKNSADQKSMTDEDYWLDD